MIPAFARAERVKRHVVDRADRPSAAAAFEELELHDRFFERGALGDVDAPGRLW